MPAISKNEMGSGRHREKRKSANVYLTQNERDFRMTEQRNCGIIKFESVACRDEFLRIVNTGSYFLVIYREHNDCNRMKCVATEK